MSEPIEKVTLTENLISLISCGVAPSFAELHRAEELGIDVKKLMKVHGDENTTD